MYESFKKIFRPQSPRAAQEAYSQEAYLQNAQAFVDQHGWPGVADMEEAVTVADALQKPDRAMLVEQFLTGRTSPHSQTRSFVAAIASKDPAVLKQIQRAQGGIRNARWLQEDARSLQEEAKDIQSYRKYAGALDTLREKAGDPTLGKPRSGFYGIGGSTVLIPDVHNRVPQPVSVQPTTPPVQTSQTPNVPSVTTTPWLKAQPVNAQPVNPQPSQHTQPVTTTPWLKAHPVNAQPVNPQPSQHTQPVTTTPWLKAQPVNAQPVNPQPSQHTQPVTTTPWLKAQPVNAQPVNPQPSQHTQPVTPLPTVVSWKAAKVSPNADALLQQNQQASKPVSVQHQEGVHETNHKHTPG